MNADLAILGTGPVGRAIARRAVGAGMTVAVSNSRSPAAVRELTDGLGHRALAVTPAEAIGSAELVVSAIPLAAHTQLPADALAGKIVVDTMNYAPNAEWSNDLLDSDELTSSQLVQRHLAASRVVKAFNNFGPHQMEGLARPTGAPDRTAMPVAGDDAAANQVVVDLLDRLGFDAVSIGDLGESWRSEPNMPVYAFCYLPPLPQDLGSIDEMLAWIAGAPGVVVTADEVESLVGGAVRGPAGFRI